LTGEELQKARNTLGVSGAKFAAAFDVSERTLRGWERGQRYRSGAPVDVPLAVALLTELALKDSSVRRRLGFGKVKVK
jgi:DNA-binding transcriptional regulator YiaG